MMKKFTVFAALIAATNLMQGSAFAQDVVTPLKGNVTITQRYYTEEQIVANIETAAGATTGQGSTSALTVINNPHNPAYNPLTGQWVEDGPVLAKQPEPLSLRDRVRSKITN